MKISSGIIYQKHEMANVHQDYHEFNLTVRSVCIFFLFFKMNYQFCPTLKIQTYEDGNHLKEIIN